MALTFSTVTVGGGPSSTFTVRGYGGYLVGGVVAPLIDFVLLDEAGNYLTDELGNLLLTA